MKFIIAVLNLLCLIVQGLGMGHNCKLPVPENCLNHPNIALSKNDMHYRLSLCSEGSCLPANHQEWIECSDVCEMCRTLPGSSTYELYNTVRRLILFLMWRQSRYQRFLVVLKPHRTKLRSLTG